MTYIESKCPYCVASKKITANRTIWLIHLANHREKIIEHLANETRSCVFCSYPEISASKKHASSHYRWAHKRSELLDWALSKIQPQTMACTA